MVAAKHGFRHTHSLVQDGVRLIWNVERLWQIAASLEREWVPIERIVGLDRNGWFHSEEPTLRNVARHAQRILRADLGHPVILNSDYSIMDGAHRVARALVDDRDHIEVVRFPEQPQPDVIEAL